MADKNKKEREELEFEMKFCEGLLEKNPQCTEAIVLLADIYTRLGKYKEGLAMDERLANIRPDDDIVFYNLACSYSLLKEIDKAFRSIKHAINCGYNDFEHLDQDPDLENLRSDPRFKRYLLRLKSKKGSEIQLDLESESEFLP